MLGTNDQMPNIFLSGFDPTHKHFIMWLDVFVLESAKNLKIMQYKMKKRAEKSRVYAVGTYDKFLDFFCGKQCIWSRELRICHR